MSKRSRQKHRLRKTASLEAQPVIVAQGVLDQPTNEAQATPETQPMCFAQSALEAQPTLETQPISEDRATLEVQQVPEIGPIGPELEEGSSPESPSTSSDYMFASMRAANREMADKLATAEAAHRESARKLSERFREISILTMRLVEKETQAEHFRLEMLTRQHERNVLSQQVDGNTQQVDRLAQQVRELSQALQDANSRAAEILGSWSWRVTGPLRAGARMLRALAARLTRKSA